MPGFVHAIPDFTGLLVDGGRYQILRMLGTGAYGAVYQALDYKARSKKSTSRAIKIIRKDDLSDNEVANLKRELHLHRIMSNDPNVVTFHHAFEDDHYVYVVLDFMSGGDLFAKICGDTYCHNDDRIKRDFVQILDAVQACHRKRIFHRDLKPENILCGEDGAIYIADFGLATTHCSSVTFGCGSSAYMSPECIGAEFDRAPYSTKDNDIWALGVVLINMIFGRNPWERATTKDDIFHGFILDEDFLLKVLPLSRGANEVIKSIFQLQTLGRISIRDLRDAILEVDTFYMTEEEVSKAPPNVQYIWDDLEADAKPVVPVPPRASPHDDISTASPVNSPGVAPLSTVSVISRGPGSLSEAGSSDSEESEGPFTPVHGATELAIEVPDLCEEQDLGDSALLHAFTTKISLVPHPHRVAGGFELGVAEIPVF